MSCDVVTNTSNSSPCFITNPKLFGHSLIVPTITFCHTWSFIVSPLEEGEDSSSPMLQVIFRILAAVGSLLLLAIALTAFIPGVVVKGVANCCSDTATRQPKPNKPTPETPPTNPNEPASEEDDWNFIVKELQNSETQASQRPHKDSAQVTHSSQYFKALLSDAMNTPLPNSSQPPFSSFSTPALSRRG